MNGTSLASTGSLLSVGNLSWSIGAIGDFNHDGRSDLVWRNYATGENVLWVMNGTTLASTLAITTVADTNWRLASLFTVHGQPMPIDTAGNSTELVAETFANATGNWSATNNQLRNGSHRLAAKAVDLAGNTSGASDPLTQTITTLVPAATKDLRLSATTDSGVSSTDDVTNERTSTVAGMAETGATVKLFKE